MQMSNDRDPNKGTSWSIQAPVFGYSVTSQWPENNSIWKPCWWKTLYQVRPTGSLDMTTPRMLASELGPYFNWLIGFVRRHSLISYKMAHTANADQH